VGSSFVIRLFGVFAFLFGLPYLIQGVSILFLALSSRYSVGSGRVLLQLVIIILDLLISAAAAVIGVGLFFRKEWARKAWLAFLIVLLLVHFHMTIMQLLAGAPSMYGLYLWIGTVILVSIISWLYLSKASTKARFH
jgi:hypothetical protein